MSIKESSCSTKLITPCYDGHALIGVQQVAGDGLSAVSIKQSHRNCKFTLDPDSKQPLLSCAQGMKARNSFWNLHKPDLRRVRGLECATTESVTQLFKIHNVANAGKPTYKRKMMRLLESLMSKKSKNQPQPLVITQNTLPENVCVLSSVCQEKEMKITSMTSEERSSDAHFEKPPAKALLDEKNTSARNSKHAFVSTGSQSANSAVCVSLPSNSSDNTFVEVGVQNCILNASNSDEKKQQTYIPFTVQACEESNTTGKINPLLESVEQSDFKLKSKQSLLQTSSNQIHSCESQSTIANLKTRDNSNTNVESVAMDGAANKTWQGTQNKVEEKSSRITIDQSNQMLSTDDPSIISNDLKSHSSKVVRSLFTEMFKEMQEIEDYIKSYSKSFYTQEEEFENYPVIETMSSEMVSHFFEQQRTSKITSSSVTNEISNLTNTERPKNAGATCLSKTNNNTVYNESLISECVENKESACTISEEKSEKHSFTKENEDVLNALLTRKLNEKNEKEKTHSSDGNDISPSGYCYWEDIDDSFDKDNFLKENYSNRLQPSLLVNTALISASFFENFWRDFSYMFDTRDCFIDLIDEQLNSSPYTPSYPRQWKNIKHQWILIEAENVTNSIDNFLDECFPYIENGSFTQSCTIEEINDNTPKSSFIKVDDDIKNMTSSSNFTKNFLSIDEIEYKLPDIVSSSYPKICSEQSSNESRLNDGGFCIGDYKSQRSLFTNFPSDENITGSLEFGYELHTSSSHDNILSPSRKSLDQIIEECSTVMICSNSSSSGKFESEIVTLEMKTEFESSCEFHPKIKKDLVCLKNYEITSTMKRDSDVTHGKPPPTRNINSLCCHPLEKDLQEVFRSCTNLLDNEHVLSGTNLSRNVSDISLTNKQTDPNLPSELQSENIKTGRSRFVIIPNTREDTSRETSSQMLFSSTNVQLNLTNPLLNANKK